MNDNIQISEFLQEERHKEFLREAEHRRLVKIARGPVVHPIEALRCRIAAFLQRWNTHTPAQSVPCATAQ